MDRSKIVAVLTGAIALILGIGYLLLVQFLDFRGEMLPAPQDLSAYPELIVGVMGIVGVAGGSVRGIL